MTGPYGKSTSREITRTVNMSKIGNQGFIRTVWKFFKRNRLAKDRIKEEVVGTDSLGNTYILKRAGITNSL